MKLENKRLKNEIISNIKNIVRNKIPNDFEAIEKFVEQYYLSVSVDELKQRDILDLYGSAISQWNFFQEKSKQEDKLRIYNPKIEEHSWKSKHTIIEIIHNDLPFIIDSIRIALLKQNIAVHLIINVPNLFVKRDSKNKLIDFSSKKSSEYKDKEYIVYLEIDKQTDNKEINLLFQEIKKIMHNVELIVDDWPNMRRKSLEVADSLEKNNHLDESEFLRWLADGNFTFLGYVDYSGNDSEKYGILKEDSVLEKSLNLLSICKRVNNENVLINGKTNTLSKIHRPAYMDFVSIGKNRFFIGLYAAVAYNLSAKDIPLINKKVAKVLQDYSNATRTNENKVLLNILETLPRDDLFDATSDELYDLSVNILHLQERQKIRLFVRKDRCGSYYSCLLFVPREKFTSQLRAKMQNILVECLNGHSVTFSTSFSESVLARIHLIIRVDHNIHKSFSILELEKKLSKAAITWGESLKSELLDYYGEERGNKLSKKYGDCFPESYKELFDSRTAVIDIEYIEKLKDNKNIDIAMSLYHPIECQDNVIKFKLIRKNEPIVLSDVVPMLENLGVRVISERPYMIKDIYGAVNWINDYKLSYPKEKVFNTNTVKIIFQEAFAVAWQEKVENDGFNMLVLGAELAWREIAILRAYYKYLWQVGVGLSQSYVEEALYSNAEITKKIIKLFKLRFDPVKKVSIEEQYEFAKNIENDLEKVESLTEDRIIRLYIDIIFATLRVNYFQENDDEYKSYFSFKFDSKKVPDLPLPKPMFEIFVYSPEVEGIHLRADKVARGGLRWSDRYEDYRTEVLGLMKAQQVKNSVIVPLGAKGGFVAKKLLHTTDRDKCMQIVIECYKTFISGLLDLTDNIINNELQKPKNTVCYDETDTYLVVAADKGTATFSDIANSISERYNFWLEDAFASGGSNGYDHKKMGITARGAWESVKLHFKNLGKNCQKEDFTVIGIGDMAGDVFGNGMLLSEHIQLVAAFNHMHIFIDPNPDSSISFKERKRLFELPRSTWENYNPKLISKGGGVFSRNSKKIILTKEIRKLLNIKEDKLNPNELIKYILKASVELFWIGGIGTFIKSSNESNSDVGDRANDNIRINADELRVKIAAEGGNLGFTQLARIEFAKNSGILNTDAIDNSAGVNCSDTEVNIKIFLNELVIAGDLTSKQRDKMLVDMSDEVASLVLKNNFKQNQAISVTCSKAADNLNMHEHLIAELESSGDLDRDIEFLPSNTEVELRKRDGVGLTRPEISVLMAYVKIILKKDLLKSNVDNDEYVQKYFINYFPKLLKSKYKNSLKKHKMKKEIICTILSNKVVDEMGINFINRLIGETGCLSCDIVRSYIVAREIFQAGNIYNEILNQKEKVTEELRFEIFHELNRLIRRGTRWFIRNYKNKLNVKEVVSIFKNNIEEIKNILPEILQPKLLENFKLQEKIYLEKGVDIELSKTLSFLPAMFSFLDVIQAAEENKLVVSDVAKVYFAIDDELSLSWFREQIKLYPIKNNWESLARASFRDDVDRLQRILTINIFTQKNNDAKKCVYELAKKWLKNNKIRLKRWNYFIDGLKNTSGDFTIFAVALRELFELTE